MIAKRLYLLTIDGQMLETYTSISLLWDYLSGSHLTVDFTCLELERELERNERFEFKVNNHAYAVKLDHPNRELEILQWMGIG